MVFDVLKIEANARSISNALLYSSDSTTEVERMLRMLEKNKILSNQNGFYKLYARQDENFNSLREGQPSFLQLMWVKLFESFSIFEFVQFLDLGKEQVYFVSFSTSLSTNKAQARCQLLSYALNAPVYYLASINPELKHELSAVLLSLTRNINSGKPKGFAFKWLRQFIPKSLVSKTQMFNRFAKMNFQNSSEYNLNAWLEEMEKKHDFKDEYQHRLNHIQHWLLPKIGLKTQQNRIV